MRFGHNFCSDFEHKVCSRFWIFLKKKKQISLHFCFTRRHKKKVWDPLPWMALYLSPPRNETSVTRQYKRAPPWIGGELQRLRLTKSHRVGHLQRAQGDICICDLFHLQGSHSFSLCMDFVHHPSFSRASQTIQRDAKATVAPNPGWISTSLCYISLTN